MLTTESAKDFATARRRAFLEPWLNFLGRRPKDLLNFDQVKQILQLHASAYKGLHEIDVCKIIGSVGKHHQFSRNFFPKTDRDELRWRRVDELFHQHGFEPIEVFQVDDAFFVRDGHHRVSVNRTHNVPTIEAYVTEYKSPQPVTKEDDLTSLSLKARRAAIGTSVKTRAPALLVVGVGDPGQTGEAAQCAKSCGAGLG